MARRATSEEALQLPFLARACTPAAFEALVVRCLTTAAAGDAAAVTGGGGGQGQPAAARLAAGAGKRT